MDTSDLCCQRMRSKFSAIAFVYMFSSFDTIVQVILQYHNIGAQHNLQVYFWLVANGLEPNKMFDMS